MADDQKCERCGGSQKAIAEGPYTFDRTVVIIPCPDCQGTGRVDRWRAALRRQEGD